MNFDIIAESEECSQQDPYTFLARSDPRINTFLDIFHPSHNNFLAARHTILNAFVGTDLAILLDNEQKPERADLQ